MKVDDHTHVTGSRNSRKPLAVVEYLNQLVRAEIEVALRDGNRRETAVPVANDRRAPVAA